MLRLNCEGAEKTGVRSRLAVLDIGNPNYDFGFSSGHGILAERPCVVMDFQGKSKPVNLIKFADDYQSGGKTDWAIIRFDKISTRGLVRYELAPIDENSLTENNKFYFAKALGLPENSQACHLSVLDFNNGRRRATHDCKAVSGQSGSPITQEVEGKHMLVACAYLSYWIVLLVGLDEQCSIRAFQFSHHTNAYLGHIVLKKVNAYCNAIERVN